MVKPNIINVCLPIVSTFYSASASTNIKGIMWQKRLSCIYLCLKSVVGLFVNTRCADKE